MGIIKEFKDFAVKGNAIDLAVGVVIGTAFGTITSSLVADIINPPLGLITGQVDFQDMVIVLQEATETTAAITLNYGMFVNTLINFLIIAFTLFLVIRVMNRLRRQDEKEEEVEKKDSPPEDILLLTEIRDELRKK